jgi:hypothetical protein
MPALRLVVLILVGRYGIEVRVLVSNSYFIIVQYSFAFGRIACPAIPAPFVNTYFEVGIVFIVE